MSADRHCVKVTVASVMWRACNGARPRPGLEVPMARWSEQEGWVGEGRQHGGWVLVVLAAAALTWVGWEIYDEGRGVTGATGSVAFDRGAPATTQLDRANAWRYP